MSKLLLVPAFLCIVASTAAAVTIHVPSDHSTIQNGISAASAGDTVLVACGTYYEHDITMRSGITLRSESGQADCATIDAEHVGHVLLCAGISDQTRVEGFTLTGGNGGQDGGAVQCLDSSPTFSNVVLRGSFASHGAGMFCGAGSSPMIEHCIFRSNAAIMGTGGGMVCESGSNPIVTDVMFEGNSGFGAAGMYCRDSSPVLTNVVFSDNCASSMTTSYG
ncbi:MAG: right-handed parallel beta-helix repeat-containing protein, partial [Candidatus Eisenbacteria bacterium]|nr:right-handed parallel beta-helix repeat-containing protein [Candidatus Eisenbacteria bacterium]